MNGTKKQIKRMFDGMLYHCMEITDFMSDHRDDEYFDTEEGKKIRGLLMKICLYHSMGMVQFLADEFSEKKEEVLPTMNLEDILKRSINGD